jgi:hypothetical protein
VKKKDTKNLKSAIKEKELQLVQLKSHIEKSDVCSALYNKVLLEKAILNKEVQDLEKNNLLYKIKKIIPRKKTFICDYFKHG